MAEIKTVSLWTDEVWSSVEYHRWITNGCPIDLKVKTLWLPCNGLTTISEHIGRLSNLLKINVSHNLLTSLPSGILKLSKLQNLNISNNFILSLPESIGTLRHLYTFIANSNKLSTLPESIGNLSNLKILNVSFNMITSFPESVGNLTNLTEFDCHNNLLKTLPESVCNMSNLRDMYIAYNILQSLPERIGRLSRLRNLLAHDNEITSIPPSIGDIGELVVFNVRNNNLSTLPAEIANLAVEIFNISGNPFTYYPPNVLRMIDRIQYNLYDNAIGIYGDPQSVHNSAIQTSVKKSIMGIISIKPCVPAEKVIDQVLSDETLTDFTKKSLVEYSCNTDLISEINISFLELLTGVWNRIVTNEHSSDIKQVLNQEMKDSVCKCFTGIVSRLVNCLNGFDPLVNVTISENEQIANVITLIGETLKKEERYTVENHRTLASERLSEMGYTSDVIDEWILHIV